MYIELYEKRWMVLTGVALAVMFLAIVGSVFGAGIQVPGVYGQVNPARLPNTPPFDQPGVRQLGPGRYEATVIAHIWAYSPNEIRVPAGATVTFNLTSRDVIHGFRIEGTNVNTMVIPGQIARVTHTFKKPGTYLFLCHEYCGVGHQNMFGRVIVE
ncbi:cytochrome c oxidase subunit II [Carboxydochorda subterranea]|uniref:Cytochrome aa3 subunit 2 n=1 Tax=Carboxydichorda subterranea TaxID=3109565 RepID=A0ABZ1BV35_9FIRM|nr:cytochrome c oxidase subunit II [Limnochorda sp. L945t]WRP16660.1 cytochrome c oxidase subunit II [Limnochorda sp. L945t]